MRSNRLLTALLCGALLGACGCQAGVMIGRILFGDPEIRPPFEVQTGVRLPEQEEDVRVVCTCPSQLSGDFGTLNIDLPEEVLRGLKKKGVPVGNVERALGRLDDLGGRFDPRKLAAEYEDGYLIHLDVERFTMREPGSNLYRGRAEGTLRAYAVTDEGPREVFVRNFKSTYPNGHPVPSESVPEQQFRRKFVRHVAAEVGRQLVRYRSSETF